MSFFTKPHTAVRKQIVFARDIRESLPWSAAMNIFLRLPTVGLIPLALWAFASSASDSRVLMEEMATTCATPLILHPRSTIPNRGGTSNE